MEQLLHWISGDFDNRQQFDDQGTQGDDAEADFSYLGLQRRRVNAPALGAYVVYNQINRRADPDDVYRQTLQVFTDNGEAGFTSRNYRFVDTERHRHILSIENGFAMLTPADIRPALPEGCDPLWRYANARYESRISRERCVVISQRDGKRRHIQATEFVEPDVIRNEESGYAADGTMIFGVPEGQYYIYRRTGQ